MRILMAHKFFERRGGGDVMFFETGRVLEENGHDVGYFATSPDPSQADGVRTFLVPPPEYERGPLLGRVTQIGRMVYSRSVKERFAEAIRTFRPDIVHVWSIQTHLTPSILAAAHDAGIPIVMVCNDYKHICPNYKLYHHGHICTDCEGGRFYMAVANRCCKDSMTFSVASALEAYVHDFMGVYNYVDMFLFASEFIAHETERFWDRRPFRWRRLRNPFDSTKFSLEAGYDDYALFFGRLSEEKGVHVLLEAASQVPDVRVRIVGDGPEAVPLRSQANELGLTNVELLGPVWGPDLDRLLARTRFVVVPSVWYENYPYVVIQSFALGKPVIGSDRGGIPELIVDGRNGLVFDPTDPAALAKALLTLWQDPERAVAMGRAAKEFADAEFNDQKYLDTILAIYREVLDG